jgi:hypothetical protein
MVLTVSFALSPVTGLCCHRHQRNHFRQLDASVGASGPHDFTVRKLALSSEAPPTSTASRPALVTIANRPSEGQDDESIKLFLPNGETKYFCKGGWTGNHWARFDDLPVGQITASAVPLRG